MNTLLRYFDLNEKIRTRRPAAVAKGGTGGLHWIPQYLALLFGVFIQPFLAYYRQHQAWNFDGGWGRLLFAAIVALIIFPQVYKKVITDPGPLASQLGVIITAGLGWQTLLDTGLKAVGR